MADFGLATLQIAQTTLRRVLGQHMLDELLSERDKINQILQKIIDEQTEPWGIKVNVVEVKDVEIPTGMQRAMARQAEAERERRAKVIAAEGEFQASTKLGDAAAVIAEHPIALQLRYLQTLIEISGTNNSTTILPDPDRHPRGARRPERPTPNRRPPQPAHRRPGHRRAGPLAGGRARTAARHGSPTRRRARSARGTRR